VKSGLVLFPGSGVLGLCYSYVGGVMAVGLLALSITDDDGFTPVTFGLSDSIVSSKASMMAVLILG
jgi:hypothetical protein